MEKQTSWIYSIAIFALLLLVAPCDLSAQLPESKQELLVLFKDFKKPDELRLEAAVALQKVYVFENADSLKQLCQQMDRYGQQQGDLLWRGYAWQGFGNYHLVSNNLDSAKYAFLKAKTIYPRRDNALYPKILAGLGSVHKFQEREDSAVYYYEKAIPWADRYAPANVSASIYLNLGGSYQKRKDYPKALQYYEKAKRYANPNTKILVEINISQIFSYFSMQQEAEQHLRTALHLAQQLNSPGLLAFAYAGAIEVIETDLRTLQSWAEKGLNYAKQVEDNLIYRRILNNASARFLHSFNRYDLAEDYLRRVEEHVKQYGEVSAPADYFITLAELRVKQKRYRAALAVCQEIKAEAGLNSNQLFFLDYNEVCSKAWEGLGRSDSALFYLKKINLAQAREKEEGLNRTMLITLVEYQEKQEKETLKRQKASAEALTKETQKRQRATVGIFALLSLFLVGIVGALYVFFRLRSRTASQLSAQNAALQRSNERLRRFSGVVSHDILSNLDLMLSAGHILVGKQAKKESLTQYYDIAQRTSRQLKSYCLGLLEEARNTVGIAEKISDPMPIVEGVLARQEIALLNKGCKVELGALTPTILPLSIVEQVFQNLVSNAIRYGLDAPEPLLRIAEEQDHLRGTTRWVVEDNGKGVPPALHEAIFDKTTTEGMASEGQNLGLSLLREALKSYGAKIWVEDRVGRGTRFVVDLGMRKELQG